MVPTGGPPRPGAGRTPGGGIDLARIAWRLRFLATDAQELSKDERARLVAAARALDSELPPANPLSGPPVLTASQLLANYTAHVLLWTDSKGEAAAVLGVNPSTLYRRTKPRR